MSDTLPIQIVNKTPYADSDIWFVITGQKQPDMPGGKRFFPWYHLTDAKAGTLEQILPSDEKNGLLDYSINLGTGTDGGKMLLPALDGGARMYFSVKNKLKMKAAGIVGSPYFNNTTPNGWNTNGDNFGTLFDWWEFVNLPMDPKTGFNANLTQVDMVGIPMSLRVDGKDTPGGDVVGFKAGARSKILSQLKHTPGWGSLVIQHGGEDGVAIAPFHGIENGTFSMTYLDPYIDAVWAHYAASGSNRLWAEVETGIFFVGSVDASGNFVFERKGVSDAESPTPEFSKPTTFQVFANQVNAKAGGGIHGSEIQGALAPALNRTVLMSQDHLGVISGTEACKSTMRNSFQPWKGLTNYYAKVVHANAIDGRAYALGNDDNCDGSSFIVSRQPTGATITLEAF
ncbi:beta-1,3-glucanase family protein [Pyxidicoccus sp. MSG2]|uniref:beta-1,3-glucanase family protein n=1 Tax=Pyxidicoccus sp. MSG2 TaxID=2996790 RepID=UPI002270E741|nr:beta-1,3-glucanase family protein [Pyxidicoccus sp. MSG2]MCY1023380.1 beta-1,3-glucanase family protein [Pyxidicoccus sp. MSG2]